MRLSVGFAALQAEHHLLERPRCVLASLSYRRGRNVDIRRLRAQGPDSALTRRDVSEGVEPEVPHGVQMCDLGDLVIGQPLQGRPQHLGGDRPSGIGMRVIALPGDVVDPYVVTKLDPRPVVDEARDDLPAEDVAWQAVTQVLPGPNALPRVPTVHPLQKVGYPPDPTL